ncbi:MAG: LysE family translocator [Chloroflexi bacterium]|nr:LysE family translocator [Chloroflexota bacterium]
MSLFLTGFGLGIAFVASPGAVTAQVLKRGFERGFMAAFNLQLGALIGMGLWAAVAFVGTAAITGSMTIRLVLGVIGGLLLLYLAWDAFKAAFRGTPSTAQPVDSRGDFALGVALSLWNPLPVAFWLGIGNGVVPAGETDSFLIFFVGFMLSALIWSFGLAALLGWGKQFVTPRFMRILNAIGGIVLAFFGFRLLWDMLS